MVKSCVVPYCKNQERTHPHLSFHRFPLTNDTLLEQWVNAIKDLIHIVPKTNHRICSEHFLKSDFTTDSRRRRILKKGVVPTVFTPYSSSSSPPTYRDSSPEYSSQEYSPPDYETPSYLEIKPEKRKIIQTNIGEIIEVEYIESPRTP